MRISTPEKQIPFLHLNMIKNSQKLEIQIFTRPLKDEYTVDVKLFSAPWGFFSFLPLLYSFNLPRNKTSCEPTEEVSLWDVLADPENFSPHSHEINRSKNETFLGARFDFVSLMNGGICGGTSYRRYSLQMRQSSFSYRIVILQWKTGSAHFFSVTQWDWQMSNVLLHLY